MALVTYAQAKAHLRLPGDDEQADVELKLAQAQGIVLAHLKVNEDDSGFPASENEAAVVQAAILKVLGHLWRARGDEDKPIVGPLTDDVIRMLSMHRDPALA